MGRSWLKCAADPLESSDEQEEQASALACKKAPPVSPAAAALRDTAAHLAAQMEAANSAVAAANKALEGEVRDLLEQHAASLQRSVRDNNRLLCRLRLEHEKALLEAQELQVDTAAAEAAWEKLEGSTRKLHEHTDDLRGEWTEHRVTYFSQAGLKVRVDYLVEDPCTGVKQSRNGEGSMDCSLTKVALCPFELSNLRPQLPNFLYTSGAVVLELPEGLRAWKDTLRELTVKCSLLQSLPDWLAELSHLETLQLYSVDRVLKGAGAKGMMDGVTPGGTG